MPESAPRRASFVLAASALLAALVARDASAATARTGAVVMGTILQVTVVAEDDATARRLADLAIGEARRWDDILTTWRSEGELAAFNARAGSGHVAVSADLHGALQRMLALSRETAGAFDPVAGALSRHFRETRPAATPVAARMQEHRIDRALALGKGTASLRAGTAVDAGGIGKGMALDAIAAMLRGAGVQAAFLDFGGSSQTAIGTPPGSDQGWKVLVTGLAASDVAGIVMLRDQSLSTSRALGTGEAGPIIDPRSGQPVAPPRLASIVAADGATAEAWSKAGIVLGSAALAHAARSGISGMVEDGSGRVSTLLLLREGDNPPKNRLKAHP